MIAVKRKSLISTNRAGLALEYMIGVIVAENWSNYFDEPAENTSSSAESGFGTMKRLIALVVFSFVIAAATDKPSAPSKNASGMWVRRGASSGQEGACQWYSIHLVSCGDIYNGDAWSGR